MFKSEKINYILIIVILIGVWMFFSFSALAQNNVGVLHYFDHNYSETRKIQQGIEEVFADNKINLNPEYQVDQEIAVEELVTIVDEKMYAKKRE